MRQRVEVGKQLIAAQVAKVTEIAHALLVSRQSLYKPRCARLVGPRPRPRPVARELDLEVRVSPESLAVDEALVVLARRHVAYGYRRLTELEFAGPARVKVRFRD